MDTAQSTQPGAVGGYRLFMAGLALMVLFGLGHLSGFLQARRAARHDPALAELTRAMSEHKTRLLGFEPSIMDFREYFSVNFSILLLLAATARFAGLSLAHDAAAAIRALSFMYVVAMLVLLCTSLIFSVAQGVISSAFIAALFLCAWWRA